MRLAVTLLCVLVLVPVSVQAQNMLDVPPTLRAMISSKGKLLSDEELVGKIDRAENPSLYEPLGQNSLYYSKYGQKGLDQYNYFLLMAKDNAIADKVETENASIQVPDHVKATADKPYEFMLEIPNDGRCVRGDRISLKRSTTVEHYALEYGGIKYALRTERDECSGDVYNTDDNKLYAHTDNDNFTDYRFYKNGKKLFDVHNVIKAAIYKSELVTAVSGGCCNAEVSFNHYDWVTGQTIATGILKTSLDDAKTP